MSIRRLFQVATGLVTGVVALGLLSLPAAADTEAAQITDGSFELYDEFASVIMDLPLTGNVGCIFAPKSVTMTGTGSSGTWSADVEFDSAVTIGAATYRLIMSIELAGSYSSTLVSATGTLTATMRRTVGGEFPCSYDTDFGYCTIEATNLALGGTHTVGAPPNIQSSDSFELMGGNTPGTFETAVVGQPNDCGALAALENGAIGFDGVELTVP